VGAKQEGKKRKRGEKGEKKREMNKLRL